MTKSLWWKYGSRGFAAAADIGDIVVDYVDDNDLDDGDDHEDEPHDQVERIERDSGDTYGCQPSPGPAAEVKVHVIREGGMAIQSFMIFYVRMFPYLCFYWSLGVEPLCAQSRENLPRISSWHFSSLKDETQHYYQFSFDPV